MKTIESIFLWIGFLGFLIWVVAILFPGIGYNSDWMTIELWKLGMGGFILGLTFDRIQALTVLLRKFKNIPTKYYWNIYVPDIALITYLSVAIGFLYFTTISMTIITLALWFIWLLILGKVATEYIQHLPDTEVSVTVRRNGTTTTYATEE